MTRDMKTILTRLFTVLMLMMFSMGAWADVKIIYGEKGTEKFEGTGGSIKIEQTDSKDDKTKVKVYMTFIPDTDKGYAFDEKSLEVYAVISPSGASTRAPEISSEALKLTEEKTDSKDSSAKRYSVDIDSNLGLWIKKAEFENNSKNNRDVTYTYYAIHNKDKGYLKQLNGGISTDGTFQYADAYGSSGSSIWILSSDGYLQQEMYYLNVANGQTLYLSTSKVTQWDLVDDGTKIRLQMRGSTKILGLNDATPVLSEPGDLTGSKKYKYAACEMTITENGTKWEGPKNTSFTVQSPQLVTYLRTYYIRNIIATIPQNDAGTKNVKVADKKDSYCYCSLTYDDSQSAPTGKGSTWDINPTSGIIYNKQASGNVKIEATYTLAALDPKALAAHPAASKKVTLTLQPSPLAPEASKNYLLFFISNADYRFPYDDGTLTEDDAVKTDAKVDVLTEPKTNPNQDISWKVVRDDEGFYSFQSVKSGRWLRFDENHFIEGSNYGAVEMGVTGTDIPTGTDYKFRLYKYGTYGKVSSTNLPSYCILPYSKQFAVFKSDGAISNINVALNVYKTPKAISLFKVGDDSKYGIFAYEAEYRIFSGFALTGPNSAIATGDYVFNTDASYSSRNIVGSPANSRDLEIKDSYSQSDIDFMWRVTNADVTNPNNINSSVLDAYIIKVPSLSNAKGKLTVTVNSLPTGPLGGKIWVQAKSGTSSGGIGGDDNRKWSGWKGIPFNLYSEPSYTDITSLSQITEENGNYRLLNDVSDAPGVTEFNGYLDGSMHKITSTLTTPMFTTLTGTVKNLILESVNISDHDGNTGAIACVANESARIYNVGILSGSVGGTGHTGGLVGLLDGSARVINCFSYANITGGTSRAGIVGYNNVASTQASLTTMVMNCMFYGDISTGGTISPIYGGVEINNVADGMNNYNYYRYRSRYSVGKEIDKYNRALAMEEKFITRFERYRLLLNSNKKLAAIYAMGSAANADQMAKWVLETADMQIQNPMPYPVLKAQGKYPSIINIDAEHAEQLSLENGRPKEEDRNKGGKIGTLTVHIGGVGDKAPGGASIIRRGAIQLPRTDKDFDRFNFNYDKVQLPYYNDVGTGNYTENRVVTGWKITSITGGTAGTYNAADDWGGYNFADRNCTNKDKYSESKRVFSQGAYWDVPEGVTAITIEPYWAIANYVSDATYDVVYDKDYNKKNYNLFGQPYEFGLQDNTDIDIYGDGKKQKVYTNIASAIANFNNTNKTVYDQAVVLVGNVHQEGAPTSVTKPYTLMSIDMNHDNEPDFSYIFGHSDRQPISPIRYDFLNIMGIAEAQIPKEAALLRNVSIFNPSGWFEITNTCVVNFSQFEYDNSVKGGKSVKSSAPLILLGGSFEQFVSTQNSTLDYSTKKTLYIHVGSNAWFAKFGNGTHSDGNKFTPHIPISVTGGDYDEFYLSGTYQPTITNMQSDNAECYISGGRFGEVAGASLEAIKGNVRWDINWADITNFYGGGVNAVNPITGDIRVDMTNSYVNSYCGGPKFGDMNTGKSVTTNATGCVFGTYFGAGFGGNAYNRLKYKDVKDTEPASHQSEYANDRGKYYNGTTSSTSYGKKGKGVATDFDYEFFVWSTGVTGARFFVKFASFSLATTHGVTSNLTKCKVTGNVYGGGSLGKVDGNVSTTLNSCEVSGSVFGGGYSATRPKVEVRNTPAFIAGKEPKKNMNIGMFEPGEINTTEEYEWKQVASSALSNAGTGMVTEGDKKYVYTDTDLSSLGSVTGNVTLNIEGSTTVGGSVYGGGEESGVDGNTEVNVNGGTIGAEGQGGVEYGNVYGGGKGKDDSVEAGLVKGTSTVTISGSPRIYHNVYGGGAYGSVGTFTYDNTTGMPTALAKEGTGVCNVTIKGGTFGWNGKENGMVFGSSRGDVGLPGGITDKQAWVYSTHVTIGDATAETSPTIKGSVYGSGENGHTFQNAVEDIVKGTIGVADSEDPDGGAHYAYRGNVYGGGCGTDTYIDTSDENKEKYNPLAGIVGGNTTVNISGGHVVHNVYGAGAMGSVGTVTDANSGKTTINISGGRIGYDGDGNGHVFGAARGEFGISTAASGLANVRETEVNISYTTTPTADNEGKTEQLIAGSVFGGGEAGTVKGSVAVNMTGGLILNDVYGGGALADTQTCNWDSNAGGWAEGKSSASTTTTVSLKGGTIRGEAYGGGLGEAGKPAYVWGDVLVDLNNNNNGGTADGAKKGCAVGQVFGCNNVNGTPKGSVTVHVYATQHQGKSQIGNTSGETPVTDAKVKDSYDVLAVYGGGNLAAYEPVDAFSSDETKKANAQTNVIIDGCGLTSIQTVYGGGNAASTPATEVTVNGTFEIEELFGGGNGKDDLPNGDPNPGANVGFKDYSAVESNYDTKEKRQTSEFINTYVYGSGKASLNVYGGTIHRVFGGSNTKGNVRQTAVTLLDENSGCDFCVDEAYGGGKSAPMDAEAKLLMACIPGLTAAYGGAEAAAIQGNVTLNITNGTFDRVFGGNNKSGTINGSITVNIEETGCKPIIIGELYGGGNLAGYSKYGYHEKKDENNQTVTDEDGNAIIELNQAKVTDGPEYNDPVVNAKSFTSIGTVYGGGYGESAVMVGNPTVNINVGEGEKKDYFDNTTYKDTNNADKRYYDATTHDFNELTRIIDGHQVTIPKHKSGAIGAINNVFGGGNAARVVGNTKVNIGTEVYVPIVSISVGDDVSNYYIRTGSGTTGSPYIYEKASGTAVEDKTYWAPVVGADIRGNVYGGGNNAEVTGDTNVLIGKKAE